MTDVLFTVTEGRCSFKFEWVLKNINNDTMTTSSSTPACLGLTVAEQWKGGRTLTIKKGQMHSVNRLTNWLTFDTEIGAGPSMNRSRTVLSAGRCKTVLCRGPEIESSSISTWFSQYSCQNLLHRFTRNHARVKTKPMQART